MFTGIIQSIGRIAAIEGDEQDIRLRIEAGKLPLDAVALGDSIATSGVCLTVTELTGRWLLGGRVSRDAVPDHVWDQKGVGRLLSIWRLSLTLSTAARAGIWSAATSMASGESNRIVEDARFWRVRVAAPANLARYIAVKGSICVDGTSLTVNQVAGASFELTIIPQTWEETVFSEYGAGQCGEPGG